MQKRIQFSAYAIKYINSLLLLSEEKNTEREYRSVLAARIAFCGDGSLDAVEVIDELIVEVGERIGSDVDVVAIAVQRDFD